MRWSIRYRLFVPLGLVLLGVVGTTIWSATAAARHEEDRIARQIRSVTNTLAGASFSLTPRILEQMKGLSGAEYLAIDPDETRISTFPRSDFDIPQTVLDQPTEGVPSAALGIPIVVEGQSYRCRKLVLRSGGILLIFYPETSLREAIWESVRLSLMLGVIVILSIGLTLLVGGRLVNRIREIQRRTRLIASGDFSPMPVPRREDELTELVRSINEMAARLSQLQETMERTERYRLIGQLSNGLAHQLRNAVTGARLAVQVHRGECPATDQEALEVVLRQLALMEANLRRFMELGRTDQVAHDAVSVGRLLEETRLLVGPQARHAGITLTWSLPTPDVVWVGDAVQLGHVFLNLIGNALEAAGPNGQVEVRCAERTTGASRSLCLEVFDSGPGIPSELAARLFEPFVTGKPEGIGLGLASAKHAVESHGGTIAWSRIDQRTCFRVELPLPEKAT